MNGKAIVSIRAKLFLLTESNVFRLRNRPPFHYNLLMSGELLRTKLYVPGLRPLLIPRPHLIKQLNQGLQRTCKPNYTSPHYDF